MDANLSAPELCYTLPSRNLRPLHHYVRMATVMVMAGDRAPIFHLYHAYSGENIWNEYLYRHGETAANIVRTRVTW